MRDRYPALVHLTIFPTRVETGRVFAIIAVCVNTVKRRFGKSSRFGLALTPHPGPQWL